MTAAALPFAAALPLTFGAGTLPAAAAAASSTSSLIPDGPATVLHHGPTPWAMDDDLGGVLCDAPKVCREVSYGWIQPYGPIEIGMAENVRRLDSAIHNVGTDPKIVYAFSGGARVASVWLRDHADDADAPDPDQLSVVLIGNGGREYGGVNGWFWGDLLMTPTDTQYDVLDIAREYDPIADFPSNPFNLLALANGIAAFSTVHLRYDEVDLDDPDNIVWKEGKTTYVYVPTEHLPLLQGFYDAGLGSLVAGIEPKLREIIDSAYNRTWLEGKPTQGEQNTDAPVADSSTRTAARSLLRAAADDAADETDAEAGTTGKAHNGAAAPAADADSSTGDHPSHTDATPPPASGEAEHPTESSPDAEAGAPDEDTPGTGKHRAPLHGTKKSGEKADTKKSGTETADTEKSGTEKSGTEKSGTDTADTQKSGTEKSGSSSSASASGGSDGSGAR